jgi:GNAT superfamily N-acetyltransferase
MPLWPISGERLRIRRVDQLRARQVRRLFHWGDDIFSGDHLGIDWHWEADCRFLGYHRWSLVGHVGLFFENVTVVNERLKVGGIGGVVTLPDAQGLGVAKELIGAVATYCAAQGGMDALLLFCQDPPINTLYRTIGNRTWPQGPVHVEQKPW